MFEQSFVDGTGKTNKPLTVLISFLIQSGLIAVGVARGVHIHSLAVDDACTLARKIVFEFLHRALVAWNDGR